MDDKEYINKYRYLVDLILIYFLKSNLHIHDKKDVAISRYFNNEYVNCNDIEDLKNKIVEECNNILDIEERCSNKETFSPLYFLFKIFDFNLFEKFCFLLGFLSGSIENYKLIFSCLDPTTMEGISLNLCYKIFTCIYDREDISLVYNFDNVKSFILGLDNYLNQNKLLLQKEILIPDMIIAFIYEVDYIDQSLRDIMILNNNVLTFDDNKEIKLLKSLDRYIGNLIYQKNDKLNVIIVKGSSNSGKKTQVIRVLSKYNMRAIFIDLDLLLLKDIYELKTVIKKLIITAYLWQRVICLYNFGNNNNNIKMKIIYSYLYQYFSFIILLSEDESLSVAYLNDDRLLFSIFTIPDLDEKERLFFWDLFISDNKVHREDLKKFSRGFVLTVGEIKNIALQYNILKTDNYDYNIEKLKNLCVESSNYSFGELAFKIKNNFSWDDIVLADDCKEKLINICNRIKYKDKVYNQWNFKKKTAYDRGISALFYGPPGTGKTMAAQIIASQIGCELYKIDLSQIIDKYIGETEKNLKHIFDKALKTNVILFFDEADALFSKRTDVSNANDKYANMGTAYLLQKIEEYDGVTILATNFLSGFDEAFKRRIKFIINFNMPDQNARLKLWKKSFPKEVEISSDIDFLRLSEKYILSGSDIKSIALSSAFYAAADHEIISLRHIKMALKEQLEKNGKIFLQNDFEIY